MSIDISKYGRRVVKDSDGSYMAEIVEFPGCIATGETAAQALTVLDDVAASWIDAAKSLGQNIPEPFATEFSGKLVLRLPKSLHRKAAAYAQLDGVSLNKFIVVALAEYLGEKKP